MKHLETLLGTGLDNSTTERMDVRTQGILNGIGDGWGTILRAAAGGESRCHPEISDHRNTSFSISLTNHSGFFSNHSNFSNGCSGFTAKTHTRPSDNSNKLLNINTIKNFIKWEWVKYHFQPTNEC